MEVRSLKTGFDHKLGVLLETNQERIRRIGAEENSEVREIITLFY